MKEKRIYFLFSRMMTEQNDKVIYEQVINYFLSTSNNFETLDNISKRLIDEKKLNFSPETLTQTISKFNYTEIFENYKPENDYSSPFKLKGKIYKNISNYSDNIKLLTNYVSAFLGSKGYAKNRTENVIEILLETIFIQNMQFLKKMLTVKQENNIRLKLQLIEKPSHFSRKDCQYYNELIKESTDDFDKILKVLVLKMFDFLSLNYNSKHNETMNNNFGGRVYYLDSSFILRLLGFDNEVREERALHLLKILCQIKDIEFRVHRETLNEAQFRIKEIIKHSSKLLNRDEKIIAAISSNIPRRTSEVLDLYNRLKNKGSVSNSKDFLIYFSSIGRMLSKIIGVKHFNIIEKKIRINKKKSDQLFKFFLHTDKSKSRIKNIISLISHIDNLRGANNYNPFDIKFWLITTDAKTLQIDSKISSEVFEESIKSVCILPTELIRTFDEMGEITDDHLKVFKKYILTTKAFKESYDQNDIQTILKIVAIVEATDKEKHNTEELINNLFSKTSFDDLQERLKLIENEQKQYKEIVEIFNSVNEALIETKYSRILTKIINKEKNIALWLFRLITFIVPIIIFVCLLFRIVNPNLSILEPLSYINEDNWGKLEAIFFLFEFIISGFSICFYRKYKTPFINKYVNKSVNKYTEK
ncbi:MAG: hypothetical protein HN952_02740 [Candidatus Cloacimonetes bacterium]|jgi:hypothetical protein|nr:hypothetical protein [Candidatus Cloacimonadota bacterium]